ncbi:MAG: DNA starvation/stationary phase protection protein [Bacteroidetes bacterium]|nr:DNA starvation/stationary phase protection protein [Bacteroidota bacterium]
MNYLGIEKEKLTTVVDQLNQLLADYHVYYQNLRNHHWNISGENFFDLHQIFEELYDDAKIKIDEIAERILTLRFNPVSNLSSYLKMTRVTEASYHEDDHAMVMSALSDHKVLIEDMRDVIEAAGKVSDEGTIDMVGSFLENLEKRSWMLDAWSSRKRKPVMA